MVSQVSNQLSHQHFKWLVVEITFPNMLKALPLEIGDILLKY